MGVGTVVKGGSRTWLLPCLLVVALLGCTTRDGRVVAKANALAHAGRRAESLRLLTDYLAQHPQSAEPRRTKILLAIQAERSEEALADYAAITASYVQEDSALLHRLALGLIRDTWRHDEGFLRARAAAALAELADPSAAWLLRQGLGHPDPTVRAHAAETVGRSHDPAFQADLERLLSDPEPFVRAEAAWAIGQLGQPSSQPLLRRALQDRHAQVRVKVAGALAMLGDRSTLSLLANALRAKDPSVRAEAARILGSLLDPSVRMPLTQRL